MYGISGGTLETWSRAELCSHLATERAGMETLRLRMRAPVSYPTCSETRSLSGLTRNWREGKPSRWFWPTQHASVPGSGLGLRDFEGGSVAGVALLLPRAVLGPARALFRAR